VSAFTEQLWNLPAGLSESLLHGAVCGVLCAAPGESLAAYRRALTDLLADAARIDEDELDRFIEMAGDDLVSPDFSFEPLLPGEEFEVDERVEGLAEWGAGFVNGFEETDLPPHPSARDTAAYDDDALAVSGSYDPFGTAPVQTPPYDPTASHAFDTSAHGHDEDAAIEHPRAETNLEEELDSADFYAGQGMYAEALDVFRKAGATLTPIAMPDFPAGAVGFVLSAEAAAAFDDLTRNREQLATLTEQTANAWPNTFRSSRFIPAVEYIRAMRARRLLMQHMDTLMSQYDVFLSPAPGSASLQITNLTGHPALALKCGFIDNMPASIMVTGRLYDEATMCRVALAYEQATAWHRKNPTLG